MEYSYRIYEYKDDPHDRYGLFEVYRRSEKDDWQRTSQAEIYGDDLAAIKAEVEMMLYSFNFDPIKE